MVHRRCADPWVGTRHALSVVSKIHHWIGCGGPPEIMSKQVVILLLVLLTCGLRAQSAVPESFWPKVYGPADSLVSQLEGSPIEQIHSKRELIDKLYFMASQKPVKKQLLCRAKYWDAAYRMITDSTHGSSLRLIAEAMRLTNTSTYDFHRLWLLRDAMRWDVMTSPYKHYIRIQNEVSYYEKIGDHVSLAECYNTQGYILDELNAPAQALEKFQKAYELVKSYGDQWTGAYMHNIAFSDYKLGHKTQALEILKRLEKQYQGYKGSSMYVSILNTLVYIYQDGPEYAHYCRKLIAVVGSLPDRYYKMAALIVISDYYMKTDRPLKAIQTLDGVLEYFKLRHDEHSVAVCLANLAESYKLLGDYKKASELYAQFAQLQFNSRRSAITEQVISAEQLMKIKQNDALQAAKQREIRLRAVSMMAVLVLLVLVLFGTVLYYRARGRESKAKLENERLKSEKQQLEIALKNKKLVTSQVMLSEKNNTLKDIKAQVSKASGGHGSERELAAKINMAVNLHLDSASEWMRFKVIFEEVYPDFFANLAAAYPMLTEYDRRLCAFYMIGLDTKQIALMLNVQPLSVQRSRSRIRKKMGLDRTDDFVTHLKRFNDCKKPS